MLANRSIPSVIVIPELAYSDVTDAANRLCEAFGFTLRVRIGTHRVQLNVGDGALVITELSDHQSARSFDGVLVRVDDVDGHCKRARGAGAKIVREPQDHP